MKYYIKRILNDKMKFCCIIFFFLLMLADLLWPTATWFLDGSMGDGVPIPALATFLSGTSDNPWSRMVFDITRPILIVIIGSEDIIEDFSTGYINIIKAKWGKNKYINLNLIKAFSISFCVLFMPLIYNYACSLIFYHGGTYAATLDFLLDLDKDAFLLDCMRHPHITNMVFILAVSFFAGFLGMAIAALTMLIRNRKIIYPLAFLMWYIPCALPQTILASFQPFTEYEPIRMYPQYIAVVTIYLLITLIVYPILRYKESIT